MSVLPMQDTLHLLQSLNEIVLFLRYSVRFGKHGAVTHPRFDSPIDYREEA